MFTSLSNNRLAIAPRLPLALSILGATVTASIAYAQGNTAVRETQNSLGEWIRLEQRIATDKQEWAVEKQVISSSIEFMEEEIDRLQKVISDAEETASAGERKRSELEESREALSAVDTVAKEKVTLYEAELKELAKSWPDAFLDMVKVPLSRIPEPDQLDSASITMRLQNVIVILSQFDKFNSVVTKDIGVQDIDGTPREVTTLYYGFSFAYFVDGSGDYAGYGAPSPDGEGWSWTTDEGLASEIQEFVAVFEQTTEANFVKLPAKITTP